MSEVLVQALRDPLIVIGASFLLGLLVLAIALGITCTKRWHDRRHVGRNISDPIGCDRCRRERNAYLDSLRADRGR